MRSGASSGTTVTEANRLRFHEDAEVFRELLTSTAAATEFLVRLIEKDYHCTVLLQYLADRCPDLIFKGGTCLAKIHTEFHRMSEDLDFTIPLPAGATRAQRSQLARPLGRALDGLASAIPGFRVAMPLTGANESKQYNAVVAYTSVTGAREQTIKIEAGVREPLLTPAIQGEARTLLLAPSGRPLVAAMRVPCLSYDEAMAEKLRAALSRREPAIRDFYDIDHAIRLRSFQAGDREILRLVAEKLRWTEDPVDVSARRLEALRAQVETELRPVLRPGDFDAFDLERALSAVTAVAETVQPR